MNIEESEYVEMVQRLYSIPFVFDLFGNVKRSDFVFLDTRTGAPLLYLWKEGETTLLTPDSEPITGSAALHDEKPWVAYTKDESGKEDYAV